MIHDRRDMMKGAAAVMTLASLPFSAAAQEPTPMFGLIGQMLAQPGKRDELLAALTEGSEAMPGCLSYIVALDAKNADALWITEVWDSKESHAASLKLPAVQAAIARARPVIAGFGRHVTTVPVSGVGKG